jgi:hypothetical protein
MYPCWGPFTPLPKTKRYRLGTGPAQLRAIVRVRNLPLLAADKAEVRTRRFRLEYRCLPLPGQVFEHVGIEQRLVKLAPLLIAHVEERRVADDLLDAAAERRSKA